MTIFPVVLLGAILPGIIGATTGGHLWAPVLAAILLAAVSLSLTPTLTARLLQRRGASLLDVMVSSDAALLHRPTTRAP